MNQELINFIQLCLSDGVISEKEKEVILRKSSELGIKDDECEIIMQSLTAQKASQNVKIVSEKEDIDYAECAIDKEAFMDVLNLDSAMLEGIVDYIKGLDISLEKATSAKYINNRFIQWYKTFPNKIVREKPENTFSPSRVYFDSSKEVELLDFEILEKEVEDAIVSRYGLAHNAIIGKGKIFKQGYVLFLKDGFADLTITEKSNMFGRKRQFWSISKITKIESVNIVEFENTDIQYRFYDLLRGFVSQVDNFRDLYDQTISLEINYEESSCAKYLSGSRKFGDDKVVRISANIKKIIDELLMYVSNIHQTDIIPLRDITFGRIGMNSNCFHVLDTIILSLKNIANMVQIRNELLLAVLKNDRSTVLLLVEKLDRMGALMNYYERRHLEKMEETNEILKKGFKKISEDIADLADQVRIIGVEVNSGINDVNETLKFHSLLAIVQSFQLYKINKNVVKNRERR